MGEVVDYALLVLPGLTLVTAAYLLARPVREPLLRTAILLVGFVLVRDAMTPAGLWSIGTAGPVPWLRFTTDPVALLTLAAGILALSALVLWRAPGLRALIQWGDVRPRSIAAGLAGGALAATPVLVLSLGHSIEDRGGTVPLSVLPWLAVFCLVGNFGEELLFRGLLQGRLEQSLSRVRSAVTSGVLFAACHAFLAITVTDVGWPILAFTLLEGLICAGLRAWNGVLPATIAHGTAIFALSSGLV